MVLKGLVICCSGTLSVTRKEFQELVEDNGAKFSSTVSKSVTHLVCDDSEYNNVSSKVAKAKDYGIPICKEDFINDSIEEGKLKDVDDYLFEKPSSPVKKAPAAKKAKAPAKKRKRADDDDDDEEADDDDEDNAPAKKQKKEEGIKKVVAKGKYPVEEDSGLADEGKIYVAPNGDAYTVTLNQTDVSHGTYGHNKYYIIQLIEHGKNYTVFTKWGRVGAKGQKASDDCGSLSEAIASFEKKFKDKSGNEWKKRANFVEKKGKYIIVEMDYSDDNKKDDDDADGDSKPAENKSLPDSKLSPRVQKLMQLIGNIQLMNDTLKEFSIDTKKMPLGKISQSQINAGYEVLQQIQDALEEGDDGELADLSSKFYSKIPHDFGRKRPPVIKDKEHLRKKIEMLQTLADLEVSSKLLDESKKRAQVNPVDAAYDSLKCELTPLDKNSDEYKMIEDYLQNTHAPTHNMYSLEVQDVFIVKREGEEERYQQSKYLGNKRLLWHGSRITNFMGILSKGLLIAPPSAPSTGYMFGKGVYFADMSSKSANYCFTNPTNNIGCMLLSEVALGNMYERLQADYITQLPKGYHSTFGKGRTTPDPNGFRTVEGDMLVPMGKPSKANIPANASLLYNEFIVYDVSQVFLRYMIQVKFNYKN